MNVVVLLGLGSLTAVAEALRRRKAGKAPGGKKMDDVDLTNVSLTKLQSEVYNRVCPNFPPDASLVPVPEPSPMSVEAGDQPMFVGELNKMVDVFRRISAEINPDKAVVTIITECASLLHADRVAIYAVDENGDLLLKGATGDAPDRIEKGKGILSHVAETAQCLTVNDVTKSDLFHASHDEIIGYKTRNLLVAPATDAGGKAAAVLEVINKLPEGEPFTALDATLVSSVASVAGMTLRNCELFHRSARNEMRANGLSDIISALRADTNANSLMFTINRRVQDLVEAEKSTFFVFDHKKHRLMSGSSDRAKQLKIPVGDGIVGHCAKVQQVINVKSTPQADPHFDAVFDVPVGIEPRAILCCPIVTSHKVTDAGEADEDTLIGVLQLVNKRGKACFNEEDQALVERVADLIGHYGASEETGHILHVSHFEATSSDTAVGEGEAAKAFSPMSRANKSGPNLKGSGMLQAMTEEGEEEEG